MSEPVAARIIVRRDGPYEVAGDVPLWRTEIIVTRYGESIDWAELEPVPVAGTYLLCRCGRSANKPFCDDSHLEGFDGTETADRGPRSDRVWTGAGVGIVVTDDRSLCAHAAFCENRFTNVWEMIGEASDPQVRDQLQRMIALCPSGRLAWAPSIGEPDAEPPYRPGITLVRDGPIWVRGGIPIESEAGGSYEVRNRQTLCRCGLSQNKPLCDGTHAEVGFTDGSAEAAARRAAG